MGRSWAPFSFTLLRQSVPAQHFGPLHRGAGVALIGSRRGSPQEKRASLPKWTTETFCSCWRCQCATHQGSDARAGVLGICFTQEKDIRTYTGGLHEDGYDVCNSSSFLWDNLQERNQRPRERVESVGIVTALNDAWTVVSRWKPLVIGRWTDPGAIDNEDCRAASWVYLGPFEMSGTSVASPFRSTTT